MKLASKTAIVTGAHAVSALALPRCLRGKARE